MAKTPDDVTAAIQKLDASDQGMAVTYQINSCSLPISHLPLFQSSFHLHLPVKSAHPNIYCQTKIHY
jgi:hypothetical protein